MRVLLPDLPSFRELGGHDEHGMPGVQMDFYSRDGSVPLPDGPADGVVLWLTRPEVRQRLLATLGLKWVLTLTAGIEHVQGHLPEGVTLFNASRLHDRGVAVHVLAGMLAAVRGLHRFRDAQARQEWTSPTMPDASGLSTLDGLKVVVWGHGHIGRILESLLLPLGAQVTGLRRQTPDAVRDEALADADWIVLLLPSTPDTRGIVNAQRLATLKRGVWISNQGRGTLIDTAALLDALNSGQVGGAVLDVTDPEPLPAGHPLWSQPNVLLTPHIASTTSDLVGRGARLTRDVLLDLLNGREPDGKIEPGRTY